MPEYVDAQLSPLLEALGVPPSYSPQIMAIVGVKTVFGSMNSHRRTLEVPLLMRVKGSAIA